METEPYVGQEVMIKRGESIVIGRILSSRIPHKPFTANSFDEDIPEREIPAGMPIHQVEIIKNNDPTDTGMQPGAIFPYTHDALRFIRETR